MARLQVNLQAIQNNFRNANNRITIFPILKCNAYGVGDQEVTKALCAEKMKGCFVNNLVEAKRINEVSNHLDIYVLNDFDPKNQFAKNIYPVISTEISLRIWEKYNPAKCILQVESGFNRHGFRQIPPHRINVEYIIGHMAGEYGAINYNDFEMFNKRCLSYPEYKKSIATSMTIHSSITKYDMARLGKFIYGGQKGENAINLQAEIIHIKDILQGETIGYDKEYTAKKDMKIAILDLGYANGFPFQLVDGMVQYKNNFLSILNSYSMNYVFIEATNNMECGEYVEMINNNITLEKVAHKAKISFSQLLLNLCNNRSNRIEYVKEFYNMNEARDYGKCME